MSERKVKPKAKPPPERKQSGERPAVQKERWVEPIPLEEAGRQSTEWTCARNGDKEWHVIQQVGQPSPQGRQVIGICGIRLDIPATIGTRYSTNNMCSQCSKLVSSSYKKKLYDGSQ